MLITDDGTVLISRDSVSVVPLLRADLCTGGADLFIVGRGVLQRPERLVDRLYHYLCTVTEMPPISPGGKLDPDSANRVFKLAKVMQQLAQLCVYIPNPVGDARIATLSHRHAVCG